MISKNKREFLNFFKRYLLNYFKQKGRKTDKQKMHYNDSTTIATSRCGRSRRHGHWQRRAFIKQQIKSNVQKETTIANK